jgi:hypothetical protein
MMDQLYFYRLSDINAFRSKTTSAVSADLHICSDKQLIVLMILLPIMEFML